MKKIIFTLLLFVAFQFSYAQMMPKGMNYQAIARDVNGRVISNSTINLRISLVGQVPDHNKIHYTEIHRVTTNENGLFTLVVGDGSEVNGSFYTVPWATEEIWMNIKLNLLNC